MEAVTERGFLRFGIGEVISGETDGYLPLSSQRAKGLAVNRRGSVSENASLRHIRHKACQYWLCGRDESISFRHNRHGEELKVSW